MVHFILATAHILNHRCVAHSVGDSINCSLDAESKIVNFFDFTPTELTF